MKRLIIILLFVNLKSFGQNCNQINFTINSDYSYVNKSNNFSIPLNSEWNILLENQKNVIVILTGLQQYGLLSIIVNTNGFPIPSAHSINDQLIKELSLDIGQRIGDEFKILTTNKSYIKNIKVNVVEFEYVVKNLDDIYPMAGIMFQIVKKQNHTYIFMFCCLRSLKSCYFPFFRNVMKQSYFGQDWYSLN